MQKCLKNEKLQDMSRIDQLTGVYNKAGFKTVVEPLLKESGSGSFIFTDLDNFKISQRYLRASDRR